MSAGDDDDEVGDRSRNTATMISSARLPGSIRPVSTPITTSTTVPAAIPIISGYRSRGSGSGTWDACGGRFLRPRVYWMRPAAMPTATRPKPQWKPAFSWSRPVRIGPRKAPRLMPR